MTLPYVVRLLCLCLTCFFLIDLLLVFMASAIAPVAIRLAERMKPCSAANFVLGMRLMPFGFALVLVAGLCVPSYLRLEPHGIAEPVGFACVTAASLAIGICAGSLGRAMGAVRRSHRYVQECRRMAHHVLNAEYGAPAFILDTARPYFSLAGLFRPRLVISSEVLSTLSIQQLKAALNHERAHQLSRDNLKRLLLILTPGIMPFLEGFGMLERAWAKFSEWAADDRATGGDAEQSLSLAEALICLSRLSAAPPAPSPLVASLLAESSDIPARIERLLGSASTREASPDTVWIAAGPGTMIVFAVVLAFLVRHTTLLSVHAALEHLIH